MLVIGQEVCHWVADKTGGEYYGGGQGIGWEKDGKLVAGVLYENFNKNSVQTHIAIDGQMTKEYLRVIFDYPFNQLKVKKIIALVDSDNEKSLSLCKNMGFMTEYVMRDAGKTAHLHILTMTRQQCRFVKD